jgi:hypothetical protein
VSHAISPSDLLYLVIVLVAVGRLDHLHTHQQSLEAPPPSHTGLLSWQAAACVLVRRLTPYWLVVAAELDATGRVVRRSLLIANACVWVSLLSRSGRV